MAEHRAWYAGRTALVTGGAGAIGSNLTRALAGAGARVLVLDDLSASERWNVPSLDNVQFIEGSVLDAALLARVFADRPSVVFHLAAFYANQNSVDHPQDDLRINGAGTLGVMEHATQAGVERFVYASSGCSIYGADAPLPLREGGATLHLSTPYQITKMLGEAYGNFFHRHYGLPVVKTRLFNCYGPGQIPGQYRDVIPNFIFWALQGRPLPITGDGGETRDFTFVDDTVDGLMRAGASDRAVGAEFNIASAREIRIGDLADRINELTGNDAGVTHVTARHWDRRKRVYASIDRAGELIGYAPSIDLAEGLRRMIAWYRKNWARLEAAARFAPDASSAAPRGNDGA